MNTMPATNSTPNVEVKPLNQIVLDKIAEDTRYAARCLALSEDMLARYKSFRNLDIYEDGWANSSGFVMNPDLSNYLEVVCHGYKDDKLLGIKVRKHFVKKEDRVYILCSEEDAEGILVQFALE